MRALAMWPVWPLTLGVIAVLGVWLADRFGLLDWLDVDDREDES